MRYIALLPWIIIICCSESTAQRVEDFIGVNIRAAYPTEGTLAFQTVRRALEWKDTLEFSEVSAGPLVDQKPFSYFAGENPAPWNGVTATVPSIQEGTNNLVEPGSHGLPLFSDMPDTGVPFDPTPEDNEPLPLPDALDLGSQIDPKLYRAHARWLTHYAVRYAEPDNDYADIFEANYAMDLAPVESFRRRLGYVRDFENQNEPDKTWHDQPWVDKVPVGWDPSEVYDRIDLLNGLTRWYMHPYQYAAQLSADYDGHRSDPDFSVADTDTYLGLKNADPNTRLVMAGLADLRGKYVNDMLPWFEQYRDGDIPIDVLNFHHYSSNYRLITDGNAIYVSENWQEEPVGDQEDFREQVFNRFYGVPLGVFGISPEDDKLAEKIGWLYDDLADEVKDLPMWLSEFGYDTHPLSRQAGIYDMIPQWPEPDQLFYNVPFGPQALQTELEVGLTGVNLRELLAPFNRFEVETSPGIFQLGGLNTERAEEGLLRKRWDELSELNRDYLFALTARSQADWLIRSYLELLATGRVEKAMMFDLRDDTSDPEIMVNILGETFTNISNRDYLFTTSGLLTDEQSGFAPKKSWFWTQTFKNVLTGYTFEEALTATASNGESVRAYRFTNAAEEEILVIWGPNLSTENISVNIALPIPPNSSSTLVTMADLDSDGISTAFSGVENNQIVDFPLSGTPAFLQLGHGTPDAAVPAVLVLDAGEVCCNAIELTWESPCGNTPCHQGYSVFFRPVPSGFDPSEDVFELSSVTSVIDHLPGGRLSAVVPNLPVGDYLFYVIPRGIGSGNTPDLQDQAVLELSRIQASVTSTDCADCILNITEDMVSTSFLPTSAFTVSAKNVLSNLPGDDTHAENGCTYIAQPDLLNPNNVAQTTQPDAEIIVDLQGRHYIDAVYHLDGQGAGDIRMEYEYCGCWFDAGLIPTRQYGQMAAKTNFLPDLTIVLPGGEVPAVHVTRLRFKLLDSDSKLGPLFICGRPIDDAGTCDAYWAGEPLNPGSPNPGGGLEGGIVAENVTDTKATVRFTTRQQHPGMAGSPTYERYEVLLSDVTGLEGSPEGAEIYPVVTSPNEPTGSIQLRGLEPNTTYVVEVRLPISTYRCFETKEEEPVRTEFTTTGRTERRSMKEATNETTLFSEPILVYPNPVDDRLTVRLPRLGYRTVQVTDLHGRMVLEQSVDPDLYGFYLPVRNLAAGAYFLKVSAPYLPERTARFVVLPR